MRADTSRMQRAALAAALIAVVLIGRAGAAAGPSITLLSPVDGATVVSSASNHPTFSWRIDWAEPQQGRLVWEIAADPAFTANAETVSQYCPATNVNCWTSVSPQEVWSPPRGHVWYWRVGFTGDAGTFYSPTWKFSAFSSAGADRQAPRVQAYAGSARRGRHARFRVRVADDHLFVHVAVTLVRGSNARFREAFRLTNPRWTLPVMLRSRRRLSHALGGGRYEVCATATDRAGNAARSCARYVVR